MKVPLDSEFCEVCKVKEESITHAFWDCDRVGEVWSKIYRWWGVPSDVRGSGINNPNGSSSLLDTFDHFVAHAKTMMEKKIMHVLAYATLCIIWIQRNGTTFNNIIRNVEALFGEESNEGSSKVVNQNFSRINGLNQGLGPQKHARGGIQENGWRRENFSFADAVKGSGTSNTSKLADHERNCHKKGSDIAIRVKEKNKSGDG
ncbi:hypothetical protein L2E82_35741 [Cichorium intybus]|uniref:Uncharacterized protein n=1 Tax=Cichorium intybus TaxID=13427 RepID=A0ACB9BPK7_CICIN|nr:hypothetical protein L2E82_35741 [Cichorium intybus]